MLEKYTFLAFFPWTWRHFHCHQSLTCAEALSALMGFLHIKSNWLHKCHVSPRKDSVKAQNSGRKPQGAAPPHHGWTFLEEGKGVSPPQGAGGLRFRLLSPVPERKDLVHERELRQPTVTLREGREMRNCRRARGSLRPKQKVFAF